VERQSKVQGRGWGGLLMQRASFMYSLKPLQLLSDAGQEYYTTGLHGVIVHDGGVGSLMKATIIDKGGTSGAVGGQEIHTDLAKEPSNTHPSI
jgi:hypothetical protein